MNKINTRDLTATDQGAVQQGGHGLNGDEHQASSVVNGHIGGEVLVEAALVNELNQGAIVVGTAHGVALVLRVVQLLGNGVHIHACKSGRGERRT